MAVKTLNLTVQKKTALETLYLTTGISFQIHTLNDEVLLSFPPELSDCGREGILIPALSTLQNQQPWTSTAMVETGQFCSVVIVRLDETGFLLSEPVLSSRNGSFDTRIVDYTIKEKRLAWYYTLLRRQPILSRHQLASFASMAKYLCVGSFAPDLQYYRIYELLNIIPHEDLHILSDSDPYPSEPFPHISESYYSGIAHAIASGDRAMLDLAIRSPHNGSAGSFSEDPLQQIKYEFVVRLRQMMEIALSNGTDPDYTLTVSESWCRELDLMYSPMEIERFTRHVLETLCDKVHEASALKGYSVYTRKAIQYVRSHLFEPLTVQKIASLIPVNRNTLSAVFKKDMHQSLQSFITEEKLKEAVSLLQQKNLKSSDIYIMLGFSSHSHFIELFKKKYGMTPGSYCHSAFRK